MNRRVLLRAAHKMRWPALAVTLGGAGLLMGAAALPVSSGRDGGTAGRRCHAGDDRVFVPAGSVLLGEDGEARPGNKVYVGAFLIDRHEVTNRQFAAFVQATGWRTRAEQDGASAVFIAPETPVDMNDPNQWWHMVEGADWRHPTGPGSTIAGKEDWPVVQVNQDDAAAYARWAGGSLPDEAQWERAARAEQSSPRNPVSWAYGDDGAPRANSWQGVFPIKDTGDDGHVGLAPVGCYSANGLGLYDMVGNVWEWTSETQGDKALIKGGSYLCAMNYCANFRPAAWQAADKSLGTSHIGFRIITSAP